MVVRVSVSNNRERALQYKDKIPELQALLDILHRRSRQSGSRSGPQVKRKGKAEKRSLRRLEQAKIRKKAFKRK